jgi:hypothetical protein
MFPTRAAALRTLRDPSRPPNAGWRTIALPSLIPPSPQPVPIAPPDRLQRWSPEERVQIA